MISSVKLGDAATFVNGYAFKPTDRNGSGLPIIRIQDLTGNAYETNFFGGRLPEKYLVEDGDLLISWSASLGIFEWQQGNAWLNQHIFKVVFDKLEWDKKFFKYLLSFKLSEMERQVHGATMKHITKGKFDNIPIPHPPISIQQKIASILDKADELRRNDQQLLAKYDELLQSIFYQMSDQANSSSKEVQLSELILKAKNSARTGPFGSDLLHSEFVDSGVAVLGIDNVVNNVFQWGKERFITTEKYEKLKRYRVFADDVLITIMGTTGRSAVVPESIPLAINTKHLAGLTFDKRIANPYFISYSVHSSPYIAYQLKLRNRGAIMEGLNLGIIKELKIKLPPIEAQNKFEAYFTSVTKQKKILVQQSKASEDLFQSLLQKAFKGELVK
jgi:type I restriction enzyme S subunit